MLASPFGRSALSAGCWRPAVLRPGPDAGMEWRTDSCKSLCELVAMDCINDCA